MADLIGYARVSSDDQSLDLQLDALRESGCLRIFQEKKSGALAERPELAKLLDHLRPGDTVVVWRLDRLGRSLKHLIGVRVCSLSVFGTPDLAPGVWGKSWSANEFVSCRRPAGGGDNWQGRALSCGCSAR